MKILISDPSIHNRQHLASYLSQSGLEVVGLAASGKETMKLAETFQPTIILLDVNLGDMDLYDLVGDLRRITPQPAVILMTTRPDPDVNRRGLLAGASTCRAKSEGIDPILAAINQIMDFHKQGAKK